MAIHSYRFPEEAQAEARILMLAAEHILNQDLVNQLLPHLRIWYWGTTTSLWKKLVVRRGMVFKDRDEAVMALRGYVHLCPCRNCDR